MHLAGKIAGSIRIVTGLAIVASGISAGYLSRSPWIVVLATPVLTLLYALGKFRIWRLAWRFGGMTKVISSVLITLPIQMVLGYLLYLVGLGLAHIFSPAPIASLNRGDYFAVSFVLLIGVICSILIIVFEHGERTIQIPSVTKPFRSEQEAAGASSSFYANESLELDMDPTPLTMKTFYKEPGYWRQDSIREALEGRGKRIEKLNSGASEMAVAAAEKRIGFRLPETLRQLYRIMDGGYVGELYVPLKSNPAPLYSEWRGAFSIDYSSLCPLKNLRTLRELYEDFTDDQNDFPAQADKLLVLQARYGDMTLLNYSSSGEPSVSIVDFDKNGDLADVEFENFDIFFTSLRRPKKEAPHSFNRDLYLSKPLGILPQEAQSASFWSGDNHAFVSSAIARGESWIATRAADALVNETESRLGVTLPDMVKRLWRARNGGDVLYCHLDDGSSDIRPFQELAPMEYFATLDELSRRIDFPPMETPWHERIVGANKLIVLNASRDKVVLLDYREAGEPSLLLVDDFGVAAVEHARVFTDVNAFFDQLRKVERSSDKNMST